MRNLPKLPEGFELDPVESLPEGFEIDSELPKQAATPTVTEQQVPEWGTKNPNLYGLYGAGKALLEQVGAPVIEDLAAVGGAIITPQMPLAGGALAYGNARQITDVLKDQYAQLGGEKPKERTVIGDLGDRANEMSAFVTIGKAFEAAGPVLDATSDYLFKDLPERLYSSAIKLPYSKKWVKVLPGREISQRKSAAIEGLRSKISPSEFGLENVKSLEKEVRDYTNDITRELSKNPNNLLKTEDLLNKGLSKAYKKAANSSDPSGSREVINKIREKFMAHGDSLTPEKANQIKRELYDEVKWGREGVDPITEKAKKGIAREIKIGLEEIYPELKSLNETDAARMFLTEGIERAIARESNTNMVGLGTKVLLTGRNPIMGIINSTIGHPQIKARLAFALAKANPSKYSKFVYPDKPIGYVPQSEAVESIIYRYNPETKFTKATIPKPFKSIIRPGEEPKVIINRSKALREAEEKERLRYLEAKFEEMDRIKGLKGSPLTTASNEYHGPTRPQDIKTTIRPGEPELNIQTISERMRMGEDIDKGKRLNELFRMQQQNPPKSYLMPRQQQYSKSPRFIPVEDRIKGLMGR